MGYVLALVAVVAFAYFLHKRKREANKPREGGDNGGGSGSSHQLNDDQ